MKKVYLNQYMILGRSNTGVYHKAVGPRAAVCNSRSGVRIHAVGLSEFIKAGDALFCSKCFPDGKPDDVIDEEGNAL